MAFTELKLLKYASDLVIDHKDFHFSNENINITPPASPIKLGTIVVRAKGAAFTDPYTVLDAADDAVDTNEFAVVFGDHHSFAYDFTPKAIAAGKFNAVGIVRDAAFKEFYIKQNYATLLGAVPYAKLKQLLAAQGLLVLNDVSDFKPA
jgi:hypothetical protein